jgi:hypothetical protein
VSKADLSDCRDALRERLVECSDDADNLLVEFDLAYDTIIHMRFTGMRHFFVESGVVKFCKASVPPDFDSSYRDDAFFCNGPMALHFRPAEQMNSVVIFPRPHSSLLDPFLFAVLEGDGTRRIPKDWLGRSDSGPIVNLGRLIYGLSLYCQAFPECVTQMPDKPMPWLQGPRTLIGKHELVDAEELRCVSPHYRRGHFRVLRHDRFQEPGRVVFVKGTFVKGTAHYVQPIEDAA